MKINVSYLMLGLGLIALSVALYLLHFFIFMDSRHIFIYMMGDLAFVPFEVFLVTLVIHRLLGEREKRAIWSKLNILIGVFFSELGTEMIGYLISFDKNIDALRENLASMGKWSKKEFAACIKFIDSLENTFDISEIDMASLAILLKDKRSFLVTMLQNPVVLEQEGFSGLIISLFHVEEEFDKRMDVHKMTDADINHITRDTWKAYQGLLKEWVLYMEYLKNGYPNLFGFAVATSPFKAEK